MLNRPGVAVAAIIAVTWLLTVFVGALVFLAYRGLGTEALTLAVVGPVTGLLVSMGSRIARIEKHVTPTDQP